MNEKITPEELAKAFHDIYERPDPQFGYETREESRVPWEHLPPANKRLMIAVAEIILLYIQDEKGQGTTALHAEAEPHGDALAFVQGSPVPQEQARRRWMPLLSAAVEQQDDLLAVCARCIWTAWTRERKAIQYLQSLSEQDEPASYTSWRLAVCQQAVLEALDAWDTLMVELTALDTQPDALLWPGAPAHALATYQAACRAEIRRCRSWAYRIQEAFLKQIEGKRVLFRIADPLSLEEAEAWDWANDPTALP